MNKKKCKKTIWLTCLLFLLQLTKIPFIVLFFNQFDTEKTIQKLIILGLLNWSTYLGSLKIWLTYLEYLKNLVNIFGVLRKWPDMVTPS